MHPGISMIKIRNCFFGRDGLRAGWRALLFVICCVALGFGARHLVVLVPGVKAARAAAKAGIITPEAGFLWEGTQFAVVAFASAIFLLIERRSTAEIYLPLQAAFKGLFWRGALSGMVALTVLLALIYSFHSLAFGGVATHGLAAIHYGLLWAGVFLFVAGFEELLFRAYLLRTLARGIGFWPAAIIMSTLFGAVHIQNAHEGWFGAAQAGIAGLFFCLTVWRTGTLWFAIGFHAAWDYAQSFVYGVPDSGLMAKGHWLNTTFSGSPWISGGAIGPEGSLLCTLVLLALFALGYWRLRPADR